ncbi:MAG: class I SAM-dependent methyltransferase [bacterium]
MAENIDARIEEYWNGPGVQSMPDRYLADLESRMVARHVRAGDVLCDLGCGDGAGSEAYRGVCRRYVGVDRSRTMLERFRTRLPGYELIEGDARDLLAEGRIGADYTVVVSQRFIINLVDEEQQKGLIARLPGLLRPDGRLLLCEAFTEGVDNLNAMRAALGCPLIEAKWHNRHLTKDLVAGALRPAMKLVHEEDLSLYYLVTRVIHPALIPGETPRWNAPINEIAYKLCSSERVPRMSGFSTVVLQVWEKAQSGER